MVTEERKGFWVVFESIDGAGKGTQLLLTADYFFNSFKDLDNIVLTREPSFGRYGRQIRELLRHQTDPKKDAQRLLDLYIADRERHLELIIQPALSRGAIVLCDRYKYSTLVYQQTQGIPLDELLKLHEHMPVPDVVFLLDVDPKTALKRIQEDNRAYLETFERLDFLTELRDNYLKLKKILPKENIVVIDANDSKGEVFAQIEKVLNEVSTKM